MGQMESRGYVGNSIQKLLKVQGVKVKKAQLETFVKILDEVCPWLCDEAEINLEVWGRVGKQLQKALTSDPDRFPESLFSYWALLNTALRTPSQREISEALEEVHEELEQIREEKSQASEPPPEPPDSPPPLPADLPPAPLWHGEPPASIYPCLPVCEERLPPSAPPLNDEVDTHLAQLRLTCQRQEEELLLEQKLAQIAQQMRMLKGPQRSEETPLPPADPVAAISGKAIAGVSPISQPALAEREPYVPTPLEMAVTEAKNRGEEIFGFPVIQTQHGGYEHRPIEFKLVKELKLAVNQYGTNAPFTTAILESLATSWLIPNDWKAVARAVLSGGDFLLWKSFFAEHCGETARRNANAGVAIATLDMLMGEGQYASTQAQIAMGGPVFDQIGCCFVRAWKQLPNAGNLSFSLGNIRQGPDEPYAEFVHRLLDGAGKIFPDAETGMPFVLQLAY
ncbi:endogenous retrovirus group K member 10 Gag polyprotein-like [Fukomys damarensis]|uniref:endogenous retrovirus group K member 10 Gag polyprotein-like n=1 Tax=Fukomys damarensis TaxID=885580 RepID=UPI00053FFA0D|nr:endogenous retrovirus group K member 10 Gag polyprotein-like [Fukomys damarensis]